MTAAEALFYQNHDEMARQEFEVSSSADGRSISFTGKQLAFAVRLARAFNQVLSEGSQAEYSGSRFDFLYQHDLADAIERSKKNRSVLFETRPQEEKYSIKVEEAGDSGSLQLRVEVSESTTADHQANLHLGYMAVMSTIKLKDSLSIDPFDTSDDVLEGLEGLLEEDGTDGITVLEVRNHREKDLELAPATFRLLGIKEADSKTLLRELWQDRSLDRVALIDLYLHLVSTKQIFRDGKHPKSDYVPEVTLKDLVDTGKHISALDLRANQLTHSAEILKKIGFDGSDIERRFINADKNRALAFRYVAWLLDQPIMLPHRERLQVDLAEGCKINSIKLFKRVYTDLLNDYKAHKANTGSKKYDLNISWQAEEYRTKLEFYVTNLLLCMNVLFEQDVDKFTKDR